MPENQQMTCVRGPHENRRHFAFVGCRNEFKICCFEFHFQFSYGSI